MKKRIVYTQTTKTQITLHIPGWARFKNKNKNKKNSCFHTDPKFKDYTAYYCASVDQFEPYLVGNQKDKFSHDVAQMMCNQGLCLVSQETINVVNHEKCNVIGWKSRTISSIHA